MTDDPRLECLTTLRHKLTTEISDAYWEDEGLKARQLQTELDEVEEMIAKGDLYRPRF